MTEIELRRRGEESLWALVDEEDIALLEPYSWRVLVGPRNTYGVHWWRREGKTQALLMHRLLTGWDLTDHIDGNGLNNQRSNLREASKSENGANSKQLGYRGKASKYKGVSRTPYGRWHAYIRVNYKQLHLGNYATQEEAALAYNVAASKHFGEFAFLNEIGDN